MRALIGDAIAQANYLMGLLLITIAATLEAQHVRIYSYMEKGSSTHFHLI